MKDFLKQNKETLMCFMPLVLLMVYFFWKSLSFPLHDFSNSYFPAHIANYGTEPEQTLFDIYAYNKYIWAQGYEDVLADFYLNSPFNSTFFYPFALISNAYVSKVLFNGLSILLFLLAIYILLRRFGKPTKWLLVLAPLLCFVSLRNQILFGQTYFLIFALVVLSFYVFEKQKHSLGASFLAFAALLKIFPVLYGLPLMFKKNWKGIGIAISIGILLLVMSLFITGTSIWETYIFEVMPNAIKNKSTVNFQYNAQSMDVFLKTLFVKDMYYNPEAYFNNEQLYFALKWLYKSIVLGIAVSLSFTKKTSYFALLSIWVVTLFLIQSRTATYAQILWLIPVFYVMSISVSGLKKIAILGLLFLICNLPVSNLELMPLLLKFSRLWFSIVLAILVYSSLSRSVNYKYIGLVALLLLPLHFDMFSQPKSDHSTYVLDQQEYFMIFDFNVENNVLGYNALGKNGNEVVLTEIPIHNFNENACQIVNNQIIMNGKQLTNSPDLKKKPVLVNGCEVFYLSDANSRRGAFTIKKINSCNTF